MVDQIITDALDIFDQAHDAENENRELALSDLRFARLSEQWDEKIKKEREAQGRPCLTINRLPAFIRQVVNDARQNKPQIRVRPVDGGADVETADVQNGLIRNIEATSSADIAYDTAVDFSASMGFGYIAVDVDFAHNDTFSQDIKIERIANPFSVWGDPFAESADGSDWNHAFILSSIPKDVFEKRYPKAEVVDFKSLPEVKSHEWLSADEVTIARYWNRQQAPRKIFQLSNGMTVDEESWQNAEVFFRAQGIQPVRDRVVLGYKVTHRVMTANEILDETEWAGQFIPVVPVYGEEINVEGKRTFKSLIRDAKDAQQMFNYWRTTTAEAVALAPKAPFIGKVGAFDTDRDKWETANRINHPYLEHDGDLPPQRQQPNAVPAGELQEALSANEDMKTIMGLHDASLGLRSNEQSGRAIIARQREGDTSTFHFVDNLSRAIRQVGRVVVDLIPKVYTGQRVIRTLGHDGTSEDVQLGQAPQQMDQPQKGNWANGVYDLTVGKYDVVVDVGPSFTTKREEAATQMIELARVYPQSIPVIGDLLVKNLDWPGADEIAERLKTLLPQQLQDDGEDPRIMQMGQVIQQLQGALREALDDQSLEKAKIAIDQFEAETGRIKVLGEQDSDQKKLTIDATKAATAAVTPFLNRNASPTQ